jgi:phage-related protein
MSLPAFPTTYVNKTGVTTPFPPPVYPIPEGVKMNNLIFTSDNGGEERRKKGDPRQSFEPSYTLLAQEAYDTLFAFFLSRGGSVEMFTWVHPVTNRQYQMRFDMDTLSGEYSLTTRQGSFWKCGLKLLQVF